MDFKTEITNAIAKTSSRSVSIYSLREYIAATYDKLQTVCSGVVSNIKGVFLNIPGLTVDGQSNVSVMLGPEDIRKVFNSEVDHITGKINDAGDEVDLSADDVEAAIEDVIEQSQIQMEFIDACLSEDTITSQSFAAAVKSKFSGVSDYLIQQYSDLFSGNDKLSALKTWVSKAWVNEAENVTNTYITAPSRTPYTGVSVWNVVITDFTDTVGSFFDNIWYGIFHMDKFFKALWEAIQKFGKWILTKAFRYLQSNLSKGDSKIGIFDFPMATLRLGYLVPIGSGNYSFTVNPRIYDAISGIQQFIDGSGGTILIKGGEKGYYRLTTEVSSEVISSFISNFIFKTLLAAIEDPDDGHKLDYYTRSFELCVPIDPDWTNTVIDGIIIKYGFDTGLNCYMSLYAHMAADSIESQNDPAILEYMQWAFLYAHQFLGEDMSLPCVSDPNTGLPSDSWALDPQILNKYIIKDATAQETGDVPIDFASKFTFITDDDLDNDLDTIGSVYVSHAFVWLMIMGFLNYSAIMSPYGESSYFFNKVNGVPKMVNIPATMMAKRQGSWTLDSSPDLDLPDNWVSIYKPYLSYTFTPTSVHLQTLSERAREIELSILAVVIAVVTVTAAIKLARYKRKLKIATEIAQGQRDNLAWNMDPSNPEDIALYKTLRRKARRLEKLSSLFGLTSTVAATAAGSKLVDTVFDNGIKTGEVNTKEIRELIKGPNV